MPSKPTVCWCAACACPKRVVDAWPWISVTGSIIIGGEALLLLLLLHRCKKREEED